MAAGFGKSARWAFSLGAQLYNVTTRWAKQTLKITLDAPMRKLMCWSEKEIQAFPMEIKRLTKAVLMENAATLPGYTDYQLALPLAYPDTTL